MIIKKAHLLNDTLDRWLRHARERAMATMRSVQDDYNCGDENVRCNVQHTFFVLWLWHTGLHVTK
jgi:hypothetical protein